MTTVPDLDLTILRTLSALVDRSYSEFPSSPVLDSVLNDGSDNGDESTPLPVHMREDASE